MGEGGTAMVIDGLRWRGREEDDDASASYEVEADATAPDSGGVASRVAMSGEIAVEMLGVGSVVAAGYHECMLLELAWTRRTMGGEARW